MLSQDTVILAIGATAAFLLVILIWILIVWAIIRSAVLSALRKHHSDIHGTVRELYRGE